MQANFAPYAEEAESAVLGGVMQDARRWVDVSAILKPDDFYLTRNKYVFEAMLHLTAQGKAIDMITVAGELRSRKQLEQIGGHAYLAQLIGSLVTVRNVESYAHQVADLAYQRRLLTASDKLRGLAMDGTITTEVRQNKAASVLLEANASTPDKGDVISFNDELNQYMDDLKKTEGMKAGISGLSTGFYDLDELFDGLQPFSLNLFGGRPGMGKSALMLSIALYVAKKGGCVYYWSGEMPRKQLRERAVAVEAGIDTKTLRRGLRQNGMSDEEYERFLEAVNRIADYQIYFDDAPAMSPAKLQSRAERLSRQIGGLTLIVVDYLQLMKPIGIAQNRNLELGAISKFLKTDTAHIAPIIAGAQLSRLCEQRADKRPILSDLRDSGELENDADTVSFVYRDVVYNPNTPKPNLMEIGIAKNRHGSIGMITTVYEPSYTRVRNAARGELL
jgi:replicative DNA helicase